MSQIIELGGNPEALDELLMLVQEKTKYQVQGIQEIPLELIDDFPDHPFQVRMDEDMDQLVESVKERGLITPITVRPKDGGRYEIVSGHRRRMACELAGITAVKADVRNLSRDEAIIMMVESNLQRSVILPSEKAFSHHAGQIGCDGRRACQAWRVDAGSVEEGLEMALLLSGGEKLLRWRFPI